MQDEASSHGNALCLLVTARIFFFCFYLHQIEFLDTCLQSTCWTVSDCLFSEIPLCICITHLSCMPGLRQSLCVICQPSIALFFHLLGRQLQQPSVRMGRHLLLRSELLSCLITCVNFVDKVGSIFANSVSFMSMQWRSYCKDNWLWKWKLSESAKWASEDTLGGKFQFLSLSKSIIVSFSVLWPFIDGHLLYGTKSNIQIEQEGILQLLVPLTLLFSIDNLFVQPKQSRSYFLMLNLKEHFLLLLFWWTLLLYYMS